MEEQELTTRLNIELELEQPHLQWVNVLHSSLLLLLLILLLPQVSKCFIFMLITYLGRSFELLLCFESLLRHWFLFSPGMAYVPHGNANFNSLFLKFAISHVGISSLPFLHPGLKSCTVFNRGPLITCLTFVCFIIMEIFLFFLKIAIGVWCNMVHL